MRLIFHRNFEKQFTKLREGEKKRIKERLALFLDDEFNPTLNNHPLRGKYQGYRSINIAGDFRNINTSVALIFNIAEIASNINTSVALIFIDANSLIHRSFH